jgi:hypothetical protein
VEWAEDCAFGRVCGFGVIDGVDKEGQAEDVGEKDEFLSESAKVSCSRSFILYSLVAHHC